MAQATKRPEEAPQRTFAYEVTAYGAAERRFIVELTMPLRGSPFPEKQQEALLNQLREAMRRQGPFTDDHSLPALVSVKEINQITGELQRSDAARLQQALHSPTIVIGPAPRP